MTLFCFKICSDYETGDCGKSKFESSECAGHVTPLTPAKALKHLQLLPDTEKEECHLVVNVDLEN